MGAGAARSREPRAQRTYAFAHGVDVLGRGAAAAADDLGACLHEMPGIARHVLGARHVHAAPAHVARHAGVRLRRQLLTRVRHHLLDRVENDLRPHRAIQADDVGAETVERACDVFGGRAVWGETISADRHLRHDRQRRIHLACRGDRLTDLVQVAEGLEDEQVGAARGQPLQLLAEHLPCLVGRGGAVRLETHAERSHGAGDEHVVPFLGRFTRQLRRAPVELARLRREAELPELDAVRAEAVRLQHFGPRLHVRAVHVAHEIGRPQVQLVVALIDEHAPGIQHRPHRAVEQHERGGVEQPVEGG
jgi:hypothetical protein